MRQKKNYNRFQKTPKAYSKKKLFVKKLKHKKFEQKTTQKSKNNVEILRCRKFEWLPDFEHNIYFF